MFGKAMAKEALLVITGRWEGGERNELFSRALGREVSADSCHFLSFLSAASVTLAAGWGGGGGHASGSH